ncbi:MAG: HesA/MoeB/ThiF family protein [Negativicutes bacterium]|nr:HesA/MoeB/ThiF family protein [Negativicutes bacterium]
MAEKNSAIRLAGGDVPPRYRRNIGTIGADGQIKLLKSRVTVVGAGGLGGTVIELLARQGLGFIRVVDDDRFAEDNLNRQILAVAATVGRAKAEVAAERVRSVNPDTTVEAVVQRLTSENAVQLIGDVDLVVDAVDSVDSRVDLLTAAAACGRLVVHGAIAGWQGQVAVIRPADRFLLDHYRQALSEGRHRGAEHQTGNPAATPALIAAWQTQETVKILTGHGQPLAGRLLRVDMLGNQLWQIPLG